MTEPDIKTVVEPEVEAVVKSTIFREYINESLNDYPARIINDKINEFHFILGFATDTYVDGKGTGVFTRSWNYKNLGPKKVLKVTGDHKNVKVIISLGGHGFEYPFDPYNKDDWIVKAKSSIKELILDYKIQTESVGVATIDGIDINYEYIYTNADVFSYCIGKVIQQLKDDPEVTYSMNAVSIAPTEDLQSHYLTLFLDNKDNIDWINYKFYNQCFYSDDEFVTLFKKLVRDYDAPFKLLAGVSTDTSTPPKMPTDLFVSGCTKLLNTASLAGVFVWDANTSAPTYTLEVLLQDLFTDE